MTAAELEKIKHLIKTKQIRPEDIPASIDEVHDAIIDASRQEQEVDGVRVTVFEPKRFVSDTRAMSHDI